ncbi:MAG: acyl carrier protein [Defluviitaleaceae bacterium]|nr:acyl carrier protein [Defluviitaleaceae bacterium]
MTEKLIKILNDVRTGVDYASEERLVDDGLIDSFDIVTLIAEISNEFDLRIPPEYILPEHFNSVAALEAMLAKVREEWS